MRCNLRLRSYKLWGKVMAVATINATGGGNIVQMRIICPNCDAQYEVPDSVIPTDGRDVECSNCGKTWFQSHPDQMVRHPDPDDDNVLVEHPSVPDKPAPAEPSTPPAPPRRQELKPEVADILREEATREAAARSAETLEIQTDLNLSEGDADDERRAREAKERMAKLRGADPEEEPQNAADALRASETAAIAASAAAVSSRRELLPDIEEINSTLRSTADRDAAGPSTSTQGPETTPNKRGFKRGFVASVALFSIATLLYVFAPQIADAVPALDPLLTGYVAWVDSTRLWLDGKTKEALEWLDAMAAASTR